MKKKKPNKYIIIVIMILCLIGIVALYPTHEYKIDCSKFGIIYLTHEELSYASPLANKINGVVLIPEDRQMIARTDILKCNSSELNKVIDSLN